MRANEKGREMRVAELAGVITAYLVLALCSSANAFPHGVAGGSAHTVGLMFDGTVVAVGHNSYGQLNVATWKLGEKKNTKNDFNGDGKADILWQHTSGTVALWLMNRTSIGSVRVPGAVGDSNWKIVK